MYLDRLENILSLKDAKYIVYRTIHQYYLRNCLREIEHYMEWDDSINVWLKKKVTPDVSISYMYNMRPYDFESLKRYDSASLKWWSYNIVYTIRMRNGVVSKRPAKDKYGNQIYLPKRHLYSLINK